MGEKLMLQAPLPRGTVLLKDEELT